MNNLNHSDVIKNIRNDINKQTNLFLELLRDYLQLTDTNIPDDTKSLLKETITNKINDILCQDQNPK